MKMTKTLIALAMLCFPALAACDSKDPPTPAPPSDEQPVEVVECDPSTLPAGQQCP